MIKAEKTTIIDRINLVDTKEEAGNDAHYIRQVSKEEAVFLVQSLLNVLLPSESETDYCPTERAKNDESIPEERATESKIADELNKDYPKTKDSETEEENDGI